MHILIIGAGPAGLAAALALSQTTFSSSLRITVLELRPKIETIGGTINLTPLALRYLDALGVGSRLRPKGIPVRGIDVVVHRTGRSLGQILAKADVSRVLRHDLVQCMVDAVEELPKERVTVRYGAKVTGIQQLGENGDEKGTVRVDVRFEEDGLQETIECDVLLGCDGIHSFVRNVVVDPERKKEYSGRAVAYGFVEPAEPGNLPVTMANGEPALLDSTMISARHGSLIMTFFEPSRRKAYLAAVMPMAENKDAREGWKAVGDDKAALKHDIMTRFEGGKLKGLQPVIAACEWFFYPVYMLPHGGVWSKGRVLLLGDAAHAMPPQGESTGVAIEDGVLFAHVLSKGASKGIPQVFAAYESLRRPDIKKLYYESMFRWNGAGSSTWLWSIVMEFITWIYIIVANWRQTDYFARDVRKFELPA
ncbi:salicylate hydroxylase [Ilyonectria destructans]|nr:salicylate hydroxylase [Ilyonectria destructans]